MGCRLATSSQLDLRAGGGQTPPAIALVTDDARWRYAELERGADRIAAELLASGMPPGARIGVMLDRSAELIATVLGVLKAGAAVVPLDVSYPRERIDLMIDRARPFRVISDMSEVRALLDEPATATLPAIDPESAAYVLFTSGSTGEPKGVAMPHRALHQRHRMAEPPPVRRRRRFHASVLPTVFRRLVPGNLFDALRRRHAAVGRRGAAQGSTALVQLVADERIERIFLTCVALQAFAEAACGTRTRLDSLRVVVNVGEQLRVTPEIRRLCAEHPRLVLENQYGPTETHEVSQLHLDRSARAVSHAAAHRHRYRRRNDQPAGCRPAPGSARNKGEIYIGGRCLALGYEGRPDLTAERFIIDWRARREDVSHR